MARAAREQTHAERLFELSDRGAQRLLRDVEPRRRTREVELFGDRQEVPQLAQVDGGLDLDRRPASGRLVRHIRNSTSLALK
jgi:hypothetical protein